MNVLNHDYLKMNSSYIGVAVRKHLLLSSMMALPVFCMSNSVQASVVAPLNSTWSEWDPGNSGAGVQTLSGQSSTGYTSSISGAVTETGEVPQAFQIFDPLRLSVVGDKVELRFDVQFNSTIGALNLDTDFRFGLSSTLNNSGALVGIDAGSSAGGTSVRMRYDANGLTYQDPDTDPNAVFDVNNMNHSLNGAGTIGSTGGTPSGNVLGINTTDVHSFVFTLERVAGGLSGNLVWTDDGSSPVEVLASFTDYDDSSLALGQTNSINMVQFSLLEEETFTTYPGGFTISGVTVTSTPVPEPSSLLLGCGALGFLAVRRRRGC